MDRALEDVSWGACGKATSELLGSFDNLRQSCCDLFFSTISGGAHDGPETVLVFVGIPLAASLLLAVLVYGPPMSRAPRYRPGRPWNHEPVWFLPQAVNAGMYFDSVSDQHHELLAPATAQAIEGHGIESAPAPVSAEKVVTGGASGEW